MKADPKPSTEDKLKVYYKKAKEVCNKYIRLRDEGKDCITSKNPNCSHKIEQACHVYNANNYPELEFNEYNIYGGCRNCNYYYHSTEKGKKELTEFFVKNNPVEIIFGVQYIADESKKEIFKPDVDYYRAKIKYFNNRILKLPQNHF